jgi:hypothetical protein
LLLSTALLRPKCLRAIGQLEKAVMQMPGARTGVHRFGGIGFFFDGKEWGHVHGNGLLDCVVGAANRDALVEAGSALPHHVFPRSGWISFWVEDERDVGAAVELMALAAARQSRGR